MLLLQKKINHLMRKQEKHSFQIRHFILIKEVIGVNLILTYQTVKSCKPDYYHIDFLSNTFLPRKTFRDFNISPNASDLPNTQRAVVNKVVQFGQYKDVN